MANSQTHRDGPRPAKHRAFKGGLRKRGHYPDGETLGPSFRPLARVEDARASASPPRAGNPAVTPVARRLRRSIFWLAVLSVLIAGVVFAVPGLHAVASEVGRIGAGWLAALVALEVLSCVGYVLCFQLAFSEVPGQFGAKLALAEGAFGAIVPMGGAGSLALGGLILHRRGMPAARIALRSAVLFLLTSAVNIGVLTIASLSIATGLATGPASPVLTVLPAIVGCLVLVGFCLVPRLADQLPPTRGVGSLIRPAAASVRATLQLLRHPRWRLVGAPAYLGCDIAILALSLVALKVPVSLAAVVCAYLVGYLANLIPIPAGLGALDAGLAGALIVYGVHPELAAAAVLIYRAISLWVPTTVGALAFASLARLDTARHRRSPLSSDHSTELIASSNANARGNSPTLGASA